MEKKGAWASLKRSFELGKKNLAFSVVLFIILAIISMIGGWTRIGVFLTAPFTALAVTIATARLAKGKK
jgi:hypothetical protein